MFSFTEFGPLKALRVQGSGESRRLCLFLHGYGANAADLYPLHEVIKLGENTDWIFPEAPLELDYSWSKAWFPIDMEELERAIQQKAFRSFSSETPKGFYASAKLIEEAILEHQDAYEEIIIGGFSQGSMLATELALRLSSIKKLILFSSNLVDHSRTEHMARERQDKLLFFQSHGRFDPILSFESARDLYKVLTDAGHEGIFVPFDGTHEIPNLVINKLNEWIGN